MILDIPSNLFEPEKAIQAMSIILNEQPSKQTNYWRALALLYLAERRCLQGKDHIIVYDRVINTQRGPVHGQVHRMIDNKHTASIKWNKYIRRMHFRIRLIADPGVGHLCDLDIDALHKVTDDFATYDAVDMVAYAREFFEEWKVANESSLKSITLVNILNCIGRLEYAEPLLEELESQSRMNIFG